MGGQEVEPYSMPVLYGCHPRYIWPNGDSADDVQLQRFEHEMRTKLTNIFRACYKHGHREVTVASKFSYMPIKIVARTLLKTITEGELSQAFSSVRVILQPGSNE